MWKYLTLVLFAVSAVIALSLGTQIVETNEATNYQIKQEAVSGKLTVKATPGMYAQMFGSITTYRISDDLDLQGTTVRFRDGSTADITGTVKYRLPITTEGRLKLHQDQKSYDSVKNVLVKGAVDGALKQTANLFGAEEVYSTKRAEFIQYFREQLIAGIYKTRSTKQVNEVMVNDLGEPIIAKPSVLTSYGFEIVNIEINNINFDQKTDALIMSRKDAEQQETLARAQAEQAKQDALTAEERGKAAVATAKYEALVMKEREVIEAQKRTAVEVEMTLQANEKAKQIEATGKAEAIKQAALVDAGLSPREQAEFDRDTAIGVAKAMSGVTFPNVMVFGGGEGGANPLNPFDAVGLKAFQEMSREKPQTVH